MPKTREKYIISGVDMYHVRNRNEQRVVKRLGAYLESMELTGLSPETIKDAYAYALNNLPARYTQRGTIVLRDPLRDSTIDATIEQALAHVIKNPK
jgi:hypothetical protein